MTSTIEQWDAITVNAIHRYGECDWVTPLLALVQQRYEKRGIGLLSYDQASELEAILKERE